VARDDIDPYDTRDNEVSDYAAAAGEGRRAHRRRSGLLSRVSAIVVAALLVASVAGGLVYGLKVDRRLHRDDQSVAALNAELASTNSALATASENLASLTSTVTEASLSNLTIEVNHVSTVQDHLIASLACLVPDMNALVSGESPVGFCP